MIIREGLQEDMRAGKEVGFLDGEKRVLLLQGKRRFGEPSADQRARIESETKREQLEIWLLSLLDATGWDAMLQQRSGGEGMSAPE